ncbi:MAG: ATP-dependent DNA helicase [Candidatus Paceibacterota bacterium]
MSNLLFETQYKKLNKAQKDAVDSLEGPVMVVAGPGTGKTQILALRIGNILKQTQVGADGVLCLTFTRSGVKAMKDRLLEYIGPVANDVRISTFHSFAIEIVEKHYALLDFDTMPKLLEEDEAVFLCDEILEQNQWSYLRPRGNPSMYFNDLKSLISILKRERLTPLEFLSQVEKDIKFLESDPDSISTRGESKGKLKKEIEKKIEGLEKTKEVVLFYEMYEDKKKAMSLMDYDDVLEYVVTLVEGYEDVRAEIKENYLYVLVDEHQDSSGVQNNFLQGVWGGEESPNIFVVGDDRQLIYGFSGARLSYFEEFATYFGQAKLITLVENYRSTAKILSLADNLLSSSISKEKLNSNTTGDNQIELSQYAFPRDEILGAGMYFSQKIEEGVSPKDCAILVPKNFHVRNAISILSNMGLPVSTGKSVYLFNIKQSYSFLRILNLINDPYNSVLISESLLDSTSNIEPLVAHKFLKNTKPDKITIDELISSGKDQGLFSEDGDIVKWGLKLKKWVDSRNEKISMLVSLIGNELLIDNSSTHSELLENVEVVRTFIHASLLFEQKNINPSLADFLNYFKRLESYGHNLSLATFGGNEGIEVMTLHKSKGLEYKHVWIAHMNEEVLMSEKRNNFSLPEKIKEHIKERDIESAKRELYVAITRAREFCNISYATENYNGSGLELASIIQNLPDLHFIKKNKEETESEILNNKIFGPKIFTTAIEKVEGDILEEVQTFVKENYKDIKITVSMLNNFYECPWKWYFRNFLKLPEVKGTSLALGSAVHGTIEFILKNKALPQTEDIKVAITRELNKEGVQDGIELARLEKVSYDMVNNWIEKYYKILEADYVSERSVQFRDKEFADLLMYGKLDLTERDIRGNISVTDFKTGKPKTKNEIEKVDEEGRMSAYMRQLAMYAYLIDGAEGGKKVESLRLMFLEAEDGDKNALYSTYIDNEKIDLLKRDISDYVTNLENGAWVNMKCNFKPWGGKSEECEYCKLSKSLILK